MKKGKCRYLSFIKYRNPKIQQFDKKEIITTSGKIQFIVEFPF